MIPTSPTAEAAHWLAHEERYERMLAPFTDHLLTSAAIGRADRVVDIGCGTGSTTRAAGRVAIEGEALGVDLSAAMLRQAARRAQEEGLTDVRFDHGDAQAYEFTPGAGGLRPGGRLVFVCRQDLADNEWILVPGAAANTWRSHHSMIRQLRDRSR